MDAIAKLKVESAAAASRREDMKGLMGGLPGGGRTPKALQLKNYSKALKLLDDNIEEALGVIIKGLHSTDKYFKFRCAELLIRKVLPDKKSKEITGEGGGPVRVETTDKRALVLGIVGMLDQMGFEELRQRVEDGTQRILEVDARAETEETERVEEKETVDTGREGPGQGTGEGESPESPVSAEAEPRDGDFNEGGEGSPVGSRS